MGYATQLVTMIAETQYELIRAREQVRYAGRAAQAPDVAALVELDHAVSELRRRLVRLEYETGPVGRAGRA